MPDGSNIIDASFSRDLGSMPATDTVGAIMGKQAEYLRQPEVQRSLRSSDPNTRQEVKSRLEDYKRERQKRTPELLQALEETYEVTPSPPRMDNQDPIIKDWLVQLFPGFAKGEIDQASGNVKKIQENFNLRSAFTAAFSKVLDASTRFELHKKTGSPSEATMLQEKVDAGWLDEKNPSVYELFFSLNASRHVIPGVTDLIDRSWLVTDGKRIKDSGLLAQPYAAYETEARSNAEFAIKSLTSNIDFGEPPNSGENAKLINSWYRVFRQATSEASIFLHGNRPERFKK